MTESITAIAPLTFSAHGKNSVMRRALLIAYWYPPLNAIGAIRPAALAKYLPRYGWEAVILTPSSKGRQADDSIIETGYSDVVAEWKTRLRLDSRRSVHEQFRLPVASERGSEYPHTWALKLFRYLLTYPDPYKGWVPYAVSALEKLRQERVPIDAVISTSPPITCHLIGRRAKQILGCPWIADLRDLWTQNLGDFTQKFRFIEVPLEKRTLREADALVTVSDPWVKRLRQRHNKAEITTITNGFDPDDFSCIRPALTKEFSIVYAGRLYEGLRDPSILLEVIRDLLAEGKMSEHDVRIRFYGPPEVWLPAMVARYGLQQVVEIHGNVARTEALQREMESQILLLLPWSDLKETGHHTGKLFEYFGAARPILAVGGATGVLTDILQETGAGVHAISMQQVRDYLLKAYTDYKLIGSVPYYGNERLISSYNHLQMAQRFAQLMNKMVTGAAEARAPEQTLSPSL
jgi:glycosyltransferase involved in cell wall biosynthesis